MTKNKDLLNTALNQLWRLISGPLMLLAIPMYLTSEEQGYWYAFTSLAALGVFADLGFTNIILQFAAHEFAFCKFDNNYIIKGDDYHLIKLANLFRFSIKWLLFLVVTVFPCIIIYGCIFFSTKDNNVEWIIPWIIYSVSSVGIFIYSMIFAFFEGCNLVYLTQNFRFKIGIFVSIMTILALFLDFKLYALALSYLISLIIGNMYIFLYFKKSIKRLWRYSSKIHFSWGKYIFPLLGKYAISLVSNYFLIQIFTIMVFYFFDEIEAGKVGISMVLWNVGYNISSIFITSNIPKINILVEQRKNKELDTLFKKNFFRTIIIFLMGYMIFIIGYNLLYSKFIFFERFIEPMSMMILGMAWFFYLIVNTFLIYIRAYKQEPMSILFLLQSIYVFISTYYIITIIGIEYLFLGFLSSYAFILPITIYFFYKVKRSTNE